MSLGSATTATVNAPADRRLDTLPSWPWGPDDPDAPRTLGWLAAGFTRGLEWDGRRWRRRWTGLIQPNGPRARKPFNLTERQTRFFLWWYAVDADGQWLYTHGARRLPKGSGKSPSGAVLALTDFLAPVRLERFDDRAPGGCLGRPVDMPWVQIAATAESQTVNTMRMVRAFAPRGSEIVKEFGLDPGKTRYYKLPEGTLEVITSSATAAEGAEGSLVIGDETEHWRPSNGGVELASTLEDNLAKSGSRMVETDNAWVPGRETVAQATYEAWLAQEEGRVRGDGRILYDAVIAPPETDLADADSLRSALEFVYADCDWKKPHTADAEPLVDEPPDVRPIMKKIWSPKTDPNDAMRKYLNWPSVATDAWVDPREWALLEDGTVEVDPDEPVVLFFDGSKSRDATSLVGCTIDTGHVFTLGVWEPDRNDPDDVVDVADVDLTVQQAVENHRVVALFADVREWEQFTLTTWPQRYRDILKVWAAPSARPPQPVAWDMRGHAYEFAKATEACHAEIVEGAFTHDGDPATARHVANARRRPYRDAVAVGKESPDSPRKIDAAVCVIGARMVRRVVMGSGKKLGTGKPARVVVLD